MLDFYAIIIGFEMVWLINLFKSSSKNINFL